MSSKMDLINLLLCRQRPPNVNQHKILGSNLSQLPPEILRMISEHLSPNDAASLVLCNHALLRALGPRHWSSLRPGKSDEKYRELFLITLTRDLPGHFYCHFCFRLHLRDNFGPPGPALQPKNQVVCVEKELGPDLWQCVHAHPLRSWYQFRFPHLQLAMKRYHYGPGHGISTESLLFTEVQVSGDQDEAERVTTLLSVEARICPRPISLCLRIQQWASVRSTNRNKVLRKTKFVKICEHLSAHSSEISRLIQSRLDSHHRKVNCQICPEVLKCQDCNTDFQIEIKDFADQGLALVVTKWLDLGSGLTPMDARWTVHIGSGKAAELGTLGTAGDVRLRFESETGLSQDTLSCQNASYLKSKRFKSAMYRWNYNTCILQAGKRLPLSSGLYSDRAFYTFIVLSQLYTVLYVWAVFFRK